MATESNLKKLEVNVGGDSQVVPLSDTELKQFEIDKSEFESKQAALETSGEFRTSALAKLAALGLTEEEIAAL
jgi:hypothetical protein